MEIPEDLKPEYANARAGFHFNGRFVKILIEQIATLRTENERLKAQLGALENPAATHDWMQHEYGFKCRKCQCIDGSTAAAYPCEGTQAAQKGSE